MLQESGQDFFCTTAREGFYEEKNTCHSSGSFAPKRKCPKIELLRIMALANKHIETINKEMIIAKINSKWYIEDLKLLQIYILGILASSLVKRNTG